MSERTLAKKVLVTSGRSIPAVEIVHELKPVGTHIDVLNSVVVAPAAPALHLRSFVTHITHPSVPDPILCAKEVAKVTRERGVALIAAPYLMALAHSAKRGVGATTNSLFKIPPQSVA